MSFTALLPQAVTIVRRTSSGENEYGNPTLTDSTETDVRGRLVHTTSQENDTTGATTLDRWTLFLSAGTDITAGDEVVEGDRRFRVEGAPQVVWGASSPHHIEAQLVYSADVTY